MRQHPIMSYLRLLGLSLGAVMFIFMIYRSSQMATNPIYVKGKPFLFGSSQVAGLALGQTQPAEDFQTVAATEAPAALASSQPRAVAATPPSVPAATHRQVPHTTPLGQAKKVTTQTMPVSVPVPEKHGITAVHLVYPN